ncbi:hypothetical protein IFM89_032883 [Coptis chinensis]|uniref:At2g35280-like TPR domain-containing protein n=1 Tax=Coptis chinensis TaxID=261450 RepID=A0A835M7L8_9MAGN|nr:hypothetical protein IFM89_032883 [Coptis chinensis]
MESGKKGGSMESEKKMLESNSILETIPRDLVLEILVPLASSSLSDICNTKRSCKTLNELGNNSYVLRYVSLEGVEVVQWEPSPELLSFLPRCEESGNPEALYRRGMVEYFCNNKHEDALKFLERATNLGHEEAAYVLGIILLCNKDESKEWGIELLNKVEKRKRSRNIGLSELRNKCKAIVRKIWLNNVVCPEEPLCSTLACKNNKRKRGQGWDLSDEDEQVMFDCKACKWDHERTLFHNMLCGSA